MDGVKVRMTCYRSDYKGDIVPSSEVAEVVWCAHKDKAKSSPVDKLIFDRLKHDGLID